MRNVPLRLVCLKTWSQLVVLMKTTMGSLGDGDLLEEVCHSGWALRVYTFTHFQLFFCFWTTSAM